MSSARREERAIPVSAVYGSSSSSSPLRLRPSTSGRLSTQGKAALLFLSLPLSRTHTPAQRDERQRDGAETLPLPRARRLLLTALQLPLIDRLLREIAHAHERSARARALSRWRAFSQAETARLRVLRAQRETHSVCIQRVVRGFLARRRVHRLRRERDSERTRQHSHTCTLFLALVQRTQRHALRERLLRAHAALKQDRAVRTIQRAVRGFLGRGKALLREMHRLRTHLQQQWSHNGLLHHLLRLTDVPGRSLSPSHTRPRSHTHTNTRTYDVETLALLYTGVSFTTLPSRPLRALPSLAQLRSVYTRLVLLHWQIHSHAHARRVEREAQRRERAAMYREEMLTRTRDILKRAFRERDARIEEEKTRQKLREESERERRARCEAAQFLQDMHTRSLQTMREEDEERWRESEAVRKECAFIERELAALCAMERERMRLEDALARDIELERRERLRLNETLRAAHAQRCLHYHSTGQFYSCRE